MDTAAIEAALAPFGSSRTLPGEAYTSPEVFAWERRNFFEGSWVCLGRSSQVAMPGDRRVARAGSEGILLVRDLDGQLRGFFNVCRHRGHELVTEDGCANASSIRCPYHAWVYGLDGRLQGAADFAGVPGFDRADFPLTPVRLEQWHGWVFANVSGDAPNLSEHIGDAEALVAPHRPERLRIGSRHDYVIDANWKVVVENYHECYHCSSIHPELCQVTPPQSGMNLQPHAAWVGGYMDLREHAQTMSLTGESDGVTLPGLDAAQRRRVFYLGLFPNVLVSLHPDYVMTHRIEPLGPGRSRIECEWLFSPEALARPGFDPSYATDFWDLTNKQDWSACESVQRGLASRGHRTGPLSPREDAVYQFITLVARGYLERRVSRPNRTDLVAAATEA